MNFDGNFSERDIPLIYEQHTGARTNIRTIRRYKTKNGYVALVHMYERYCLFFADESYVVIEVSELIAGKSDIGAIEATGHIAKIIGAEQLT